MKRLLFSALLLCCAVSLRAQSSRTIARLDSLFDALEAADQMRGSVAVSKGDRIIYTRSLGPATMMNGKPVAASAQTGYRIGSITKTFTAVLIMQLVEEGKLTLDTKLSKFFPVMPIADRITIEQLLSHRSGLANFTQGLGFLAYMRTRQTRADMLPRLQSLKPDFSPDSTHQYSNTNYMLLGWIIEDLRRKSFDDALRDGITARLGMQRTRAADSVMPAKGEALSFSYADGKWMETPEWHGTVTGAAGNMVSTPSELLRFAHALYTGKLLKPETVKRMQQVKGQLLGGKLNGYGLGMFTLPFGRQVAWGHNGGVASFHSNFGYFAEDSVGYAVLLNTERYSLQNIIMGIHSAIYDKPFTLPDFNRKAADVPEAVLQRYAGTYFSKDFPLKIFVRTEGGKLIARATGQGNLELVALSETEFYYDAAGINLRFAQGTDGAWNVMYLDQRGHKVTFTKEIE